MQIAREREVNIPWMSVLSILSHSCFKIRMWGWLQSCCLFSHIPLPAPTGGPPVLWKEVLPRQEIWEESPAKPARWPQVAVGREIFYAHVLLFLPTYLTSLCYSLATPHALTLPGFLDPESHCWCLFCCCPWSLIWHGGEDLFLAKTVGTQSRKAYKMAKDDFRSLPHITFLWTDSFPCYCTL